MTEIQIIPQDEDAPILKEYIRVLRESAKLAKEQLQIYQHKLNTVRSETRAAERHLENFLERKKQAEENFEQVKAMEERIEAIGKRYESAKIDLVKIENQIVERHRELRELKYK